MTKYSQDTYKGYVLQPQMELGRRSTCFNILELAPTTALVNNHW